jgi:hypothetical protein
MGLQTSRLPIADRFIGARRSYLWVSDPAVSFLDLARRKTKHQRQISTAPISTTVFLIMVV